MACSKCRSEFRTILENKKKHRKVIPSTNGYIATRILKFRPPAFSSDPTLGALECPDTVHSSFCFLYVKTKGPQACSTPASNFSRPWRLLKKEGWMIQKRIQKFAELYDIGTCLSSHIVENGKNARLCPKHAASQRKFMEEVEANRMRCSVCDGTSSNRPSGDITPFSLNRFNNSLGARCMIEDSLALRTDNRIQISDLK